MIRILLADDHDVVRRGLRHLVEEQPGWEVCAEATTGRQAVALAEQHKPDVAVLDISMPELNGLEATRQITKALLPLGACVGEGQGFFFRKSGGARMADWLQTGNIARGRRVRGSNSTSCELSPYPRTNGRVKHDVTTYRMPVGNDRRFCLGRHPRRMLFTAAANG